MRAFVKRSVTKVPNIPNISSLRVISPTVVSSINYKNTLIWNFLNTTLICSKSFTMKPTAALDCIDDAHIACFGRLAAGHFARPRANAAVLLEGLRVTS
jgi:hypothetical protein